MKNNNKKLFIKIISSSSIMLILSLMLVSLISFKKSEDLLKNQLQFSSSEMLEQVKNVVYGYLDNMIQQMDLLSKNRDIQDLNNPEENYDYTVEFIQDNFGVINSTVDGIENVYYADDESGKMIFENQTMDLDEFNFKESDWYVNAKNNLGKNIYTEPYVDELTKKKVLTISRSVVNENGNFIGVVAVDLNIESVQAYVNNISLMNSGYVVVADKEGRLIANNEKIKFEDDNISKLENWSEISSKDEGSYKAKINNANTYVSYTTDGNTGWKIIGFIDENEIKESLSEIRSTIIWASLLCLAISILVTLILVASITKNIKKINDTVRKIADGYLKEKIEVKSKDEIGELAENFNYAIDNVSNILKSVEETANEVYDSSSNIVAMSEETKASVSEVANAIDGVATGASNQAMSVQNITNTIDNLAAKIENVDNNASQIVELSNMTENLSNEGLGVLSVLIEKAEITKSNTKESAEAVKAMAESINKINYISDAIAGITEQTNLLALNASIEAARAGEAGKGFAVVAEEIRKLAEQSKESTDEIKEIVSDISKKSGNSTTAMDESMSMLMEQDKSIESTKEIFNKIVDSIKGLAFSMKLINDSTHDMNGDKEIVTSEINGISNISQEVASVSEEVTASSEEVTATMNELAQYTDNLNIIAERLKEQLKKFEL